MLMRKAVPVHSTAVSTGTWDGPANEARLKTDAGAAVFRQAFAWQDPAADAGTKAAWRFVHHEVAADGTVGAANMMACMTGIGVLNGGRGGTTIPDADRAGVYRHLAAHMRDGDKMPPPMRSDPAEVERRFVDFELRVAQEDDAGPTIQGYAAVFNQASEPLPFGREQIAPGAFTRTLKGKPDIRALWNHDSAYVLGRTTAKTLSLAEDETGLAVQITPPDTSWARDLMMSIKRGDVNQMSFGFVPVKDRWETDEKGNNLRTLLEVAVREVSVVSFPAYTGTSAMARAMDGQDMGDMLEMLDGQAFDEQYIESMITHQERAIAYATFAAARADSQEVLSHAEGVIRTAQAEIASLRQQADRLSGRSNDPPVSLLTPLWRRKLELLALHR